MDDNLRWRRQQLMETAGAALEKNGFATMLFPSRQEAVPYLMQAAAEATTVGFGGSMTITELGLAGFLAQAGKKTLLHTLPGLSPAERRQVMQEQLGCDLFFTSTNALTLKGQLVNIDATGNRVGAMAFGPKRVIVVAGANKLVVDLDSALKRIKEMASPPNARRLGYKTPCAQTGVCSDCNSPQRICRITTIIEKCPRATDIQVCLINEDFGY